MKKYESPSFPVTVMAHNAGAVQALIRGDCPDHLQKDFIRWLIEDVCGTYDQSYRESSERDTCFAEGKRWVGNTIVKASKLDPAKLESKREEML